MIFPQNQPSPPNQNNPSKEIWLGPDGTYNNTEYLTTSSTTTTTTTEGPSNRKPSIIPASGYHPSFQTAMISGAIPELLSSAKWSNEDRGYPQQTFLGASIRGFNMQGGFGDSSSSLTVDLVVDEFNESDKTNFGFGDDVYHSGGFNPMVFRGDKFVPPIPGSPVFFKFGPNFATVEEAYRQTFDDLYNFNTRPNTSQSLLPAGSVPLIDIIEGRFNLLPNMYVDLFIEDYIDGGVIKNENAPRSIIKYSNIINNTLEKGRDHIVFGGILQTYTQNRSPAGNPLYTVGVVDPREILSNVTLILNNYAGPTYEQKNVLNIYGFLEYNPTDNTISTLQQTLTYKNILNKSILTTQVNPNDIIGSIILTGDDKYYTSQPSPQINVISNNIKNINLTIATQKRIISEERMKNDVFSAGKIATAQATLTSLEITLKAAKISLQTAIQPSLPTFPITGTGFSRRGPQGIPYYRIQDAVNALMEFQMPLPQEYKNQGFGGKINFRGYNYVVDFGGLPPLPSFYYLDFDQINLLELALEICDISNRDLYVSLLPVIDHPACKNLFDYNNTIVSPFDLNNPLSIHNMIAGIIRLDAIDRSEQPIYGAIKSYIDSLSLSNIYVESQDLGYELSNIVTDKFIVGAQEVDMYYFSTNSDRDNIEFRRSGRNGLFLNKPEGYQWTLEASFDQQVLPYYGKLGNNAVTIPKGFGAYQQILLDSSSLNAAGVGSYYVATEMELRCALISFDRWKEFLQTYNDIYMESIESDDPADAYIAGQTATPLGSNPPVLDISSQYVVTVPRSVFDTYVLPINNSVYGTDGLPLSPCNPPYGYPLYYKRMTKIGIPEGGLVDLFNRWVTLNTNFAELRSADKETIKAVINSQYQNLKKLKESQELTQFEKDYYETLENLLQDPTPKKIQDSIGLIEGAMKGNGKNMFAILPSVAKKNIKNALKVYEFVKSIAEECLGKKFLVKIPKEVNLFYDKEIKMDADSKEYTQGPFGFRPRSTQNIAGYEFTSQFRTEIRNAQTKRPIQINAIQSFLNSGILPNPTSFTGALRVNYNPISSKYESNYMPTNIGGYFPFDLYQNTIGSSALKTIGNNNFNQLPSGVQLGLVPQDLTNFINEDGRISAYVRFDNSEDLTLEGLNDSDFTQQFISVKGMVPDLIQALDNTGPDEFHSFPNVQPQQDNGTQQNQGTAARPKQVAFVKCSVDEQLYFPPKIKKRKVKIHAQEVKDIGTKSIPQKIFIPCSGIENDRFVSGSGVYVDSFSFYKANFVPLDTPPTVEFEILDFERYNPFINLPGGTQLNNSEYVQSELENLNTDHAYALITLPNRILPNKDSRFRDGMFQNMSTEKFKHLMTMDVVRGLSGFDQPSNPLKSPPKGSLQPSDLKVPIDARIKAWLAMKKIHAGLCFGFPYQIGITMPSPVYPDLVSLPLMSNDRCYGPWISSQLDGQAYLLKNIGGKVEFIKDENLSPWNYGGYQLMNEAGRMQAQFSNSLLLFSERGSFTIPSFPKGNSLCKALVNGGPLVTSINVDVSQGGVKTTYQMDLYTASFGKLQKQKQEEISKISRERKKLISERNALIRKGLGKNQSNRNFTLEYNMMKQGIVPGLDQMGLPMANAMTNLVTSVSRNSSNLWSSNVSSNSSAGNGVSSIIKRSEYYNGGSLQNPTQISKTAASYNDQFDLAREYQNAADQALFGNGGMFAGMSHGYHANLPYRPNYTLDANEDLYFIDPEDSDNDFRNDITKYGDMA